METHRDSPTTHVNNRIRKTQRTNIMDDILKEYCLKRNIFNPQTPSPNIFISKLEKRMRIYYNTLYSSSKRRSK